MNRSFVIVAVFAVCALLSLSPLMIFAFRDGEAATLVLGQPNLTTGTVHTTRTGMSDPSDVVVDSSGNVWVADNTNARVLEFVHPVKTGQAASLVLGQSSFTTRTMATSKTGLSDASGIALDSSGNVWVADAGNNRVLEFVKGTGFKNGQAASLVLGQSSYTSNAPATSATGMYGPSDITFDSSGNLWVADYFNNRVLEFVKGAGFKSDEAASIVLGQLSMTTNTAATTPTGMYYPDALSFGPAGNLWVSDEVNNRVLQFTKGPGFTDGEAASIVLGQPSFFSNTAATSATGMNLPEGLAIDSSGNVWASDYFNNRVLEFLNPVKSGLVEGEAASIVLGQTSLTTKIAATTPTGLRGPADVTIGPVGALWVADSANNRVLRYPT